MTEKKKKPAPAPAPEKHLKLNVQALLDKKELSIAEFARRAGFEYRTAHDIVTGKYKRIGINTTLAKILIALDCKIEELIVWE